MFISSSYQTHLHILHFLKSIVFVQQVSFQHSERRIMTQLQHTHKKKQFLSLCTRLHNVLGLVMRHVKNDSQFQKQRFKKYFFLLKLKN